MTNARTESVTFGRSLPGLTLTTISDVESTDMVIICEHVCAAKHIGVDA